MIPRLYWIYFPRIRDQKPNPEDKFIKGSHKKFAMDDIMDMNRNNTLMLRAMEYLDESEGVKYGDLKKVEAFDCFLFTMMSQTQTEFYNKQATTES